MSCGMLWTYLKHNLALTCILSNIAAIHGTECDITGKTVYANFNGHHGATVFLT